MIERIIKEMEYSANRTIERIAEGTYKGFDYYVLSLGSHPCAYVDISDTPLAKKGYNEMDISCHGGLTYGGKHLHTVEKTGWFIGWDYAHYLDYVGYLPLSSNDKRWTTSEIVEECREVIDQLDNLIKVYKQDLKPCPFCGGKATYGEEDMKHADDSYTKQFMIYCVDCGASMSSAGYDEYDTIPKEEINKTIEAWNRRIDNDK